MQTEIVGGFLVKREELLEKWTNKRREERFLRTGRAFRSPQAVGEGVSQLKTIKDVWVSMRGSGQGGNAHAALVPLLQLRSAPPLRGFLRKLARAMRLFLPEDREGTGTCWRGWITPGRRRWVAVTKRLTGNVEPVFLDQIHEGLQWKQIRKEN